MNQLPALDFIIYKDASTSEFLAPFGCLTTVRNISPIVDHYKQEFGHSYDQITRQVIPDLMHDKIVGELGITEFSSSRFFFNSDSDRADYVIKFYNPEEFILFKMAYYGTGLG
jgi:hypothetical protein